MVEEITDAQIRRYQNLKYYRDKTPDEIREIIRNRASKPVIPKRLDNYEDRFNEKLDSLIKEFAVDMNSSNDIESLKSLVRLLLQNENIDRDIRAIQDREASKDDFLALDKLGDLQRKVQMSISDLQEKLGISRKARKEKSNDDIPQFIDSVLNKAKTFFDRKTVTVDCPKCQIELVRYWLNFPDLTTLVDITTECPRCQEIIKVSR